MIRRGAHKTIHALEADIRAWAKDWNEDPRPFIWTKCSAPPTRFSCVPPFAQSSHHRIDVERRVLRVDGDAGEDGGRPVLQPSGVQAADVAEGEPGLGVSPRRSSVKPVPSLAAGFDVDAVAGAGHADVLGARGAASLGRHRAGGRGGRPRRARADAHGDVLALVRCPGLRGTQGGEHGARYASTTARSPGEEDAAGRVAAARGGTALEWTRRITGP